LEKHIFYFELFFYLFLLTTNARHLNKPFYSIVGTSLLPSIYLEYIEI
jgi:hypothetical protein